MVPEPEGAGRLPRARDAAGDLTAGPAAARPSGLGEAPPAGTAPPVGRGVGRLGRTRRALRRLHYGHRPRDVAFQAALLTLDVAALTYFVVTTFTPDAPWIATIDVVLGLLLTADFLGRMFSYRRPVRFLESFTAITDLVVIVSLLAHFLADNLGFLRALRLLRAYQILDRLSRFHPAVNRREELVRAALNVLVFVVVTSAVVYVTQHPINPKIGNFVDALYFTVTSLTTTGYGDIALEGVWGRLLSVLIMLSGISLFLGLVQAVFRPTKVRHQCPSCGLTRHEPDAVHCKACGQLLNIPDHGD